MAEHGPSEAATNAAQRAAFNNELPPHPTLRRGLVAAHDSALGLDRSVCLRDVVGVLREMGYAEHKIAYVIRAFTESSSPDRGGEA